MANLYAGQGKYTEAEPLYQRGLSVLEQAFGPNHVALLPMLDGYQNLLEKMGQPARAAQLKARAARIRSDNAQANGLPLPAR